MTTLRVFRTECYKIFHRRQSLLLLLPALVALVMVLGYSRGIITLSVTTAGAQAGATLLDVVFMVWSVENGLGLVGVLSVLFAALAFAGERENGQIKLALLRIGKRRDVVLGKFLAVVCACLGSILLLLAAAALGHLLFAPEGQHLAAGASIYGLTPLTFAENLALNLLQLLMLLALTFFVGCFCGPFAAFALTMVALYGASALAAGTSVCARVLPLYWANALLLDQRAADARLSVLFALVVTLVLLFATVQLFRHQDVR